MKDDITKIFPLTFTGTDRKFATYNKITGRWIIIEYKEVKLAKILKQL